MSAYVELCDSLTPEQIALLDQVEIAIRKDERDLALNAEEWAALERRFWAEESEWAKAGSGQTSAQQTGASMVFAWLRSPQGGNLQRPGADR